MDLGHLVRTGCPFVSFWTPESLDTLIFSNYVGAAVVFEYQDGKISVSRVNKKYLKELGMNLSEKDVIDGDVLAQMNEADQQTYISTLERAIQSMDEEECETWRNIESDCCGVDRFLIRSNIRLIGKSKNYYLKIKGIQEEACTTLPPLFLL